MNTQSQQTAIAIAREAGALLREGYGQAKQIGAKSSPIDLVTQYDTAAETLIVDLLRRHFPHDAILGEEGGWQPHASDVSGNGRGNGRRLWLVDPLDGTINFAHGFPAFAVSLALYEGERPLLGVVYDPLRDECFHAARGEGAFLSAGAAPPQPLRVSPARDLLSSLLATGFPYDRHHSELDNLAQFGAFLKRAQGIRRAGSAALDVAYVAAGRLDGYWEYKLSSWDIAAAILLVHEAGGQTSAMDGSPFRLNTAGHNELVASNGRIHDEILGVLHTMPA